ncbi:MAG TPA: PIG-L deacetylase family protein [Ktedonosporobacter sp.]|nr:PIG-L deacetylase family protein [Ktedonosporobacter sp.]
MSEQELNKVAMVIAAHADDIEFGAAGTAARWARDGWDVYYVLCTDGGSGGPDEATDVSQEARQRVIDERKQEQRAAAAVTGVKEVIFLDYPDGQLEPSLELRRDLVRLIRTYRPSRIVCQSPDRSWTPALSLGRYHPDHRAAGEAALNAIYPASQNPWDFPELFQEGLKPHKISEVYVMGAPVVNHAVDISETLDVKMAALRAHSSQLSAHFDELEVRLREWAADTGKRHGMEYAEEFHFAEHR